MVRWNRVSAIQEADKREPIHMSKQHFAMKARCRGVTVPNRLNVEEYCCRLSIAGADASDVRRFRSGCNHYSI